MSNSIKKQNAKGGVPTGWRKVKLGDVGEFRAAGVDKKIINGQNKSLLVNYLDVLNNNFINNKMLNHWVTANNHQMSNCEVKVGDILFTPSSEIQGDIAHSAVITETIKYGVYSYHIFRYRLKENWNLKYRGYAFKGPYFYRQAHRLCQGSGQRYTLSIKDFQNMTLLVPTTKIQKQIASIISTWDKAIEKIELLIAAQERQFKGVINSLLNDKANQINWRQVILGEVVTHLRGAASITKKDLTNEGKNKCIHYGQLYTTYRQVIKNIKSYTNVNCHTKSKVGDILIPGSTTADAMGIATASALLEDDVIIGGDINVLRIDKKYIDAVYLAYLLSNGSMKKQLASYARGTNILHLLGRDIIKINIPLPPLNRQKQIASIISTWDDAIEKNKMILKKYKSQKQGIIQQIFSY